MDFNHIDHLLFGGPDLDQASIHIHQLLGHQPITGGSHPGKGTRNQLLGLSHGAYLEIIGPDPAQQVDPVWMNIDQFIAPHLFRWAAKFHDLESLRERAFSKGIDIGEIQSGERQKPDGSLLKWKLTNPDVVLCDGLVPFFIDWGEAGNPSPNLLFAAEIIEFYGMHPQPDPVKRTLDILEVEMEIRPAKQPALMASLQLDGLAVQLQ